MGLLSRFTSSEGEEVDDRRPSPRVRPLRAEPVLVHIMASESLDILHARDISVSGVGVLVRHRFEGCDLDAEVELVVTLPGARPFQAKGVIKHVGRAHARSTFFGVEFTDLRDDCRELIEAYVARRMKERHLRTTDSA